MTRLVPILVVLLVLAGCGSGSGDQSGTGQRSPNPVDRAFAAAMIPHHRSAIEMADLAERRASAKTIRQLAGGIAHVQEEEIGILRAADRRLAADGIGRGDLRVPGHMRGMEGDVAGLRRARPFDRAFLEAMIPHHEGAIAMARAELRRGGDAELRDLARRIVSSQAREIRFMRRELDDAGGGGAAIPDGGQAGGHAG